MSNETLIAEARGYGLDVEEERADVDLLAADVVRLRAMPTDERAAAVERLNEGEPLTWLAGEEDETTAIYLGDVPGRVPEGRIVVHNDVRPAKRLGVRGFRAWTEPVGTSRRAVCDCRWAPHLPEHYRVDNEEDESNG